MSENCKIWEGNIATIETREKICFRSSMFNKKDGKVQNYYYTLNQGTFVILLPNVIFFFIFPPNLEGTKSLWIGVKTHPYLSFFFLFFFLLSFPESYCGKLISSIFFSFFFFCPLSFRINQMHPSALPIHLFQFFFFFFLLLVSLMM